MTASLPSDISTAAQQVTGDHVELSYADQRCTGHAAEEAAADHGIPLEVAGGPYCFRAEPASALTKP